MGQSGRWQLEAVTGKLEYLGMEPALHALRICGNLPISEAAQSLR